LQNQIQGVAQFWIDAYSKSRFFLLAPQHAWEDLRDENASSNVSPSIAADAYIEDHRDLLQFL
jgi:hypothetical protein